MQVIDKHDDYKHTYMVNEKKTAIKYQKTKTNHQVHWTRESHTKLTKI